MSTKSTLWHNDVFHLYSEGFDIENVYLEIAGDAVGQLVVKIPLAAWKEMRQQTIQPAEQYLDLSDEELLLEASRQVDEHRARLEELRQTDPQHSPLRGLLGSFLFGLPNSSREEMIANFLNHYRPGINVRES
jgi:hypothetical protein